MASNPTIRPQKLLRQPAGKTRAKAIGKANPVTPAQRTVPWGARTSPMPGARKSPENYRIVTPMQSAQSNRGR